MKPLLAQLGAAPSLLDRIDDVEEKDGYWEASIDGTQLVVFAPKETIDPCTPESLRAVLQVIGGIAFGEIGTYSGLELHDGLSSGTLHTLGKDAGLDAKRDGFGYSSALCAPIDAGLSVFYLFHPDTGEL